MVEAKEALANAFGLTTTLGEELQLVNDKYDLNEVAVATFDSKIGPSLFNKVQNTIKASGHAINRIIRESLDQSDSLDPLYTRYLSSENKYFVGYYFDIPNNSSRGGLDMYTLLIRPNSINLSDIEAVKELEGFLRSVCEEYKSIIQKYQEVVN